MHDSKTNQVWLYTVLVIVFKESYQYLIIMHYACKLCNIHINFYWKLKNANLKINLYTIQYFPSNCTGRLGHILYPIKKLTEIKKPCSSTLKVPGGYLVTVLPIPLVLEDSCQSKVCNLQVAGGADEKVGRLQILELYTLHYWS